jgi:hypothetical protein
MWDSGKLRRMWDSGKLRQRTRDGLDRLIDGLSGLVDGLTGFFVFFNSLTKACIPTVSVVL